MTKNVKKISGFSLSGEILEQKPVANGRVITISERSGSWITLWLRDADNAVYLRDWKGHKIPMCLMSYSEIQACESHNVMCNKFEKLFALDVD